MSGQNQFDDPFEATFLSPRSNWAKACAAPSSPVVDRLKRMLNTMAPENIRELLAEAEGIVDQADAGHTALLIELAKYFSETFPGEPLPLTFE
jgi:hypothetical protein